MSICPISAGEERVLFIARERDTDLHVIDLAVG